jgi:pimeloyl-ACP methyl ester carboxylesterase
LQLAARGRAESVVALAPAGGWAAGDRSVGNTLDFQLEMHAQVVAAMPHVDAIVATAEGRRRATQYITSKSDHLPPRLVAHLLSGVAGCAAVEPMVQFARRSTWPLDAERIACPVRVVWGAEDRLLAWPAAAARYRRDLLPTADWVVLAGVGHCPQLDVPLETAQLILGFTGG